MLDNFLTNVTVIGAAGKMGSGIALLLLQEISRLQVEKTGKASGARINLIDVNDTSLDGLHDYLRAQMIRFAEKNIVALRTYYQDNPKLIENTDIIQTFVNEGLLNVRLDTDIEKAKDSKFIFEAIIEDVEIKNKIFTRLKALCPAETCFFTNTSSIPISVLNDGAGLDNRIIGYHFYNPPAMQRLVEVITTPTTDKQLVEVAYELGKRLKKKLIPSNDVAGFIGNGHFMRDLLFGIELAVELMKDSKDYAAIYMINKVSQEFMIRPMGIFQLIDYVGVDVCQLILKIMRQHLNKPELHNEVIDRMKALDVKGGQNSDGSQKDGFIQYKRSRPVGFYCMAEKRYVALDEGEWLNQCDQQLGALPEGYAPWRNLLRDPGRAGKLETYFANLFQAENPGAQLAQRYLLRSQEIARELVSDGIAAGVEDVNQVLENGFFHLYGPVNELY